MPRVKSGAAGQRRKKRILRAARGYRGSRHRLYRTAKEAVTRAGVSAYRDRRLRKRDFRSLWIIRVNAACRQRGISYSQFIHGLKAANVSLDRKMLAEIAVSDPAGFDAIVELARQAEANKVAA
jgi:large subunit ribosomal protein L20